MILPENCQAGDLIGIFSPDGRTFRGMLIVREVFPGSIAFSSPLPQGARQGDILCLIRRKDEHSVKEAILPPAGPDLEQAVADARRQFEITVKLYREEVDRLKGQNINLRSEIHELKVQMNGVPIKKGIGRRIKSSTDNSKIK